VFLVDRLHEWERISDAPVNQSFKEQRYNLSGVVHFYCVAAERKNYPDRKKLVRSLLARVSFVLVVGIGMESCGRHRRTQLKPESTHQYEVYCFSPNPSLRPRRDLGRN
jgi:hypothetical protein